MNQLQGLLSSGSLLSSSTPKIDAHSSESTPGTLKEIGNHMRVNHRGSGSGIDTPMFNINGSAKAARLTLLNGLSQSHSQQLQDNEYHNHTPSMP
jgi:hypothetical protein